MVSNTNKCVHGIAKTVLSLPVTQTLKPQGGSMKLFAFVVTILFSVNVWANDFWPVGAKNSYVDRCSQSMQSQGLSGSKARSYCSCLADGMESEFGMREYDAMMRAQPNPNGTSIDRRLYKVAAACGKKL